jgi:hypothetical protein
MDYFQHPDRIPDDIQAVLFTCEDPDDYSQLEQTRMACVALGWDFDNSNPFNLKPIKPQ